MCGEDSSEINEDIKLLSKGGYIDTVIKQKLQKRQKSVLVKLPSTTITMLTFSPKADHDKQISPSKKLLPVDFNGKTVHIRKTTAVWLFQDGERVSSDRLFRVRCKQPYSSSISLSKQLVDSVGSQPVVSSKVQLGEFCVFKKGKGWSIGRILQFAKYKKRLYLHSSLKAIQRMYLKVILEYSVAGTLQFLDQIVSRY